VRRVIACLQTGAPPIWILMHASIRAGLLFAYRLLRNFIVKRLAGPF
jgi:hypothetical protein